jgi:hypothetical protein
LPAWRRGDQFVMSARPALRPDEIAGAKIIREPRPPTRYGILGFLRINCADDPPHHDGKFGVGHIGA